MRSYYSHLQKLDAGAPKAPILRSSAIFPVFQEKEISTRLIFLGYWLLKRNIEEIKAVVTIRAENGETVKQIPYPIREPRTYRVEVKDLIEGFFIGTIEIEFYSEKDLVFPYPAVTVNYYGPNFSTVVHTAERTYNDAEDAKKSGETHVPESGFNLYSDANHSPIITLINGKENCPKQTLQMDFYNSFEEKLSLSKELEPFNPFEIRVLHPAEEFPLSDFFRAKPGTCKIDFNLKGVFPRLLVGNRQKNPFGQVITHSYYDCTEATDPSNFWTPADPKWHAASLMFPLMSGTHTTTISFYPIFSPSPFALDLEVYNQAGQLTGSFKEILTFDADFDSFQQISLGTLYPSDEIHSVRAYVRALSETPIPSRIKFAIDIGVKDKGLPCNICTNLQPYVPAFTTKKSSFKWGPLLADQPKNYAFLMNSSPEIEMTAPAEIKLTFYREKDTQIIEREVTLAPQTFMVINPAEDKELADFLEGKIGWFTAITSNPYLTTYYFAENPSGIIGGDHGY
jgi:hypothetical protein